MNKLKQESANEKAKNDIVGWTRLHVATRFTFDI
jgi:hypothetical protein